MSTKAKQSDRVNLRIARRLKSHLLEAAKVSGRSLTDFVLASAFASAEHVLAARTTFVLSRKNRQKFNSLLDAAPREIPRLKRLFKDKSVFDKA